MEGQAVIGRAGRLDQPAGRETVERGVDLPDVHRAPTTRALGQAAAQLEAVRRSVQQEDEQRIPYGHVVSFARAIELTRYAV
ncbi:hypothetical protein GCM10022282_18340 [Agromyces indicus]